MQLKKKRWLGLAFAPALFALFGFASSASAYTCANVPTNVTGDIIITEPGDCTISNDITATNGSIQINAGGLINAQGITTTGGGNVLLTAVRSITTNNITTGDGAHTGGVEINAYTGGGANVFTIGGARVLNSVGTINTSNTSGGGTIPTFITGGLFITNGTPTDTGGISVANMTGIQVNATASRSGIIMLNAQNGQLSLPVGTLNSIGAAGQGGGSITLLARTIATANGTIINASQDYTASGTNHGVTMAAQTLTVTGTSGLQVKADGNGITGSPGTAFTTLAPQGSFTLSSNGDVHNLLWTINSNNFFFVNDAVTVSGTAPFTMTADGNYGRVSVTGHPVTFSNKAVTLQSKAATSHEVIIGYNGTLNSTLGIGLNGTGTATIDVTAVKRTGDTTANGGSIQLYGDKMTFNSPTLKFLANGPTSGNGDGGTVYINSTSALLKVTSKATISANAASAAAGTGNASANAIQFFPGAATVEIGNDAGQYVLSATGGKKSGNGGTVYVNPLPGNINVHNSLATTIPINVSAIGTTGNGGTIRLIGNTNVTFAGTALAIKADGGTQKGDGGTIQVLGNGTVNLGSATNAATLSAKAPGTTNTNTNKGGTVEMRYTSDLTVDGLGIDVSGGGNAAGGTINLHDLGKLKVTGELRADGKGSGKAGTITLASNSFNTMTLDGSTISASGDPTAGTGDGNQVTINNLGPITTDNAKILSNGGGASGNGGKIIVSVDPIAPPINVTTAKFEARGNVDSNQTGKGGSVSINKATGTPTTTDPNIAINVPYVFYVDGGSSNTVTDMGAISLNSVTCHQWKTVAAVYPKVGWDCITPDSGANISTLVSAGASLPTTIQNQLANLISPPPAAPKIGVFAHKDLPSHEKFFGLTASGSYSKQFGISYVSWLRLSSTFAESQGVSNATLSGSPTIMVAALVHELGHNLDYIWGPGLTNYSSQTAWTNLIAPDFATMDGLPCATVFYQATCDNYPTLSNSQRFDARFPGIAHKEGELFAAMFEHVESFLTGNPPSYQVEPELEKALDTMLRLKAAMSNLIASPPAATK